MTSPEFHEFLQTFLTLASSCCAPGSIADVCMDWRHMGEVLKAGEGAGLFDGLYGPGSDAFFALARGWRDKGEMSGLDVR